MHILIIDETPLFREYLRLKLEENSIEVSVGINSMDGISKMRINMPDLVIVDHQLNRQGFMEVLRQKKANPNTGHIPVIVLAQRIEQKQLLELVSYNVKKVFTKPVKIDALFTTISELLGIQFTIDESPSIMDVHVNDSIIFIEIAQGLNRDKLDLLRFKILELIDLYEIKVPKVILMMSDIRLSFADAPNMQKLLNTVIQASRAKLRYIRVLTMDDFVRQFINGRPEYSEIEVVTNLQFAVDGLLAMTDIGMEHADAKAEIIGDRLLRAKNRDAKEAMVLKFDAEAKSTSFELMKDSLQNLQIAVVDDDFLIQELIKKTFRETGAVISSFQDGKGFLETVDTVEYDLAFLDINMPGTDGFEVLKALQVRDIRYPVIVISGVIQRETMIRAFRLGVKSYLVKPMKPEDIFRKSLEILKANF